MEVGQGPNWDCSAKGKKMTEKSVQRRATCWTAKESGFDSR
jgi:hypothetical protein